MNENWVCYANNEKAKKLIYFFNIKKYTGADLFTFNAKKNFYLLLNTSIKAQVLNYF